MKSLDKLQFCNAAIKLKNELENGFMTLAEHLYTIKEGDLFVGQWSSWSEFTAELKMSENSVNKLIQIYKTFVLEYKFQPKEVATAGGWSAIAEILPIIDCKEAAEEWLHKARELTREDLRKEVKEEKSGHSEHSCRHLDTYTIVVCRGCGSKIEGHKDHEH